jgi:hypothetical protein
MTVAPGGGGSFRVAARPSPPVAGTDEPSQIQVASALPLRGGIQGAVGGNGWRWMRKGEGGVAGVLIFLS